MILGGGISSISGEHGFLWGNTATINVARSGTYTYTWKYKNFGGPYALQYEMYGERIIPHAALIEYANVVKLRQKEERRIGFKLIGDSPDVQYSVYSESPYAYVEFNPARGTGYVVFPEETYWEVLAHGLESVSVRLVETYDGQSWTGYNFTIRLVAEEPVADNGEDEPEEFSITTVSSDYCSGQYEHGRPAIFLSGVNANVEFTVSARGGDVAYIMDYATNLPIAESNRFTINVGSFAPGETLTIYAISQDGCTSKPYKLNFDVASQHRGVAWRAFPGRNSILYKTVELDTFQIFEELSDEQPDPLGLQDFNPVQDIVDRFSNCPQQLTIGLNVGWVMESSDGVIRGVALFGANASNDYGDHAFTERLAALRRNGGRQTLRFCSVDGFIKIGVEQTWSWRKDNLVWRENGNYLALNAGASGCFFRNWLPTPIPWYYSAEGGLELYLRARLANGGLQYAVDSDKLIYITLRIGVGIPSTLALEASGMGRMFLTYDTEANPRLQRLGLALDVALQLKALGIVVPAAEWQGSWNWVDGQTESTEMSQVSVETVQDKTMADAIKKGGFGELASKKVYDEYDSGTDDGDIIGHKDTTPKVQPDEEVPWCKTLPTPIAENGIVDPAPVATPKTGSTGVDKGKKIASIAGNAKRSPRRRYTLITVHDAGDTYVVDEPVWDDGTPDFNPDATTMNNGDTAIVWMNEKELDGEEIPLGTSMAAMEIAAAIWDDATGSWHTQNLTDDNVYDRSPVICAATNGTAAVAWIRNSYTNYIGSVEEPNQICFARYADGEWSQTETAVETAYRVQGINLAFDGVNAAIAYNEEDAPTAGTNQVLCVAVRNQEGNWSLDKDVELYAKNDSLAEIFYDEIGRLNLMINKSSTVKTMVYAAAPVRRKLLKASAVNEKWQSIDTDGHDIPGDYVFVRSDTGQMAMLWTETGGDRSGDETATEIVGMMYHPDHGQWSYPSVFASDGKDKRDISAAFNENHGLDICFVSPNSETNAEGFAEIVSADWSVMSYPCGGDVAIFASDVSLSATEFAVGETVPVTFTVKNVGDTPAYDVLVSIDESSDLLSRIVFSEEIAMLGVRESRTFEFEWVVPEEFESSEFFALSCNVNATSGSDKNGDNDSVVLVQIGSSDAEGVAASLVNMASWRDEWRPHIRHISVAVRNDGAETISEGTQVSFILGDEDGEVLGVNTLGAIVPGDESAYDTMLEWDISNLAITSRYEKITLKAELPVEEDEDEPRQTLIASIKVDVSPEELNDLNSYTLRYDGKGGSGEMEDERVMYDAIHNLVPNRFVRIGYEFAGWSVKPDAEVVYKDGARARNIAMYEKGVATLYAVWKRVPILTIENGVLTAVEMNGCTELRIPGNVVAIAQGSLAGCGQLTTMEFEGDAPSLAESVFDGIGQDCVAIVRRGTRGWNTAIPGVWCNLPIKYYGYEIGDVIHLANTNSIAEVWNGAAINECNLDFIIPPTDRLPAGSVVRIRKMTFASNNKSFVAWDVSTNKSDPYRIRLNGVNSDAYDFGGTIESNRMTLDSAIAYGFSASCEVVVGRRYDAVEGNEIGGVGDGVAFLHRNGSLVYGTVDGVAADRASVRYVKTGDDGSVLATGTAGGITGEEGYCPVYDLEVEVVSIPTAVVITLDATGGGADVAEFEANVGSAIGELPVPARPDYEFVGWFTAETGGEQVSSTWVVPGETTLYAHWAQIMVWSNTGTYSPYWNGALGECNFDFKISPSAALPKGSVVRIRKIVLASMNSAFADVDASPTSSTNDAYYMRLNGVDSEMVNGGTAALSDDNTIASTARVTDKALVYEFSDACDIVVGKKYPAAAGNDPGGIGDGIALLHRNKALVYSTVEGIGGDRVTVRYVQTNDGASLLKTDTVLRTTYAVAYPVYTVEAAVVSLADDQPQEDTNGETNAAAVVWSGGFGAAVLADNSGYLLEDQNETHGEDGSSVTIDRDNRGLMVNADEGTRGVTVLVKYSDLTPGDNRNRVLFTSSITSGHKYDRTGVQLRPDGKLIGLWNPAPELNYDRDYGTADGSIAAEGVMAFTCSIDDGTYLYYGATCGDMASEPAWGDSGLKSTFDTAIYGVGIGGMYRAAGKYGAEAAKGMTIYAIAVFDRVVSVDEMRAYKWPDEAIEDSGQSVGVGDKGVVETNNDGVYVIVAKEGVTLTEADFVFAEDKPQAAYKVKIAGDGKTATVALKEPQVGTMAVPLEEGESQDEEDQSGLLVVVDEAKIVAKPTPQADETVGVLPVKTYIGLWYQAAWGEDLLDLTYGDKVKATGDSLYLGVIKQKADKGFYKLRVSEQQ